jgi:hypothetical protein
LDVADLEGDDIGTFEQWQLIFQGEASMSRMVVLHAVMTASLLLSCAWSKPVGASEKRGRAEADRLTVSYIWREGTGPGHEQKVWINPSLLAELNPTPSGEVSLKSAFAGARVREDSPGELRLWQVGKDLNMDEVQRRLKSLSQTRSFLAVFHDDPFATDPIRVAPGNIIVYLNPEWTEAAVQQWAQSRQLTLLRKLEVGRNIFVIQSGPGLEALTLANSLYETGSVLAAFPDWWTPKVRK